MTKSELKQKLEAVTYRESVNIRGEVCWSCFNDGANLFLPLLLDAYEALDKVGAGAVCRVITPKEEHGQILDNCLKISAEILARIEAFATQGAHEQSEFENGEK